MSSLHEAQRVEYDVGTSRLSALVAGPEDGKPALLLHGIPTGAELWRDVCRKLANEGYRCYAPDLPGYGKTRLPKDGAYGLAGASELLARWMSQENIGPVWVIGHDLGSGVAQILATKHSALVSHLTLSDGVAPGSWPVKEVKLLQWIARARLLPVLTLLRMNPGPKTRSDLKRAFVDKSVLDKETEGRIFWDTKTQLGQGLKEFTRHIKALSPKDTDAIAEPVKNFAVPTLLLWPSDDIYQPWQPVGTWLSEQIPAATSVIIEGSGHFVQLEKLNEYIAELLYWRKTVDGKSTAGV